MSTRQQRWGYLIGGLAFIAVGAWCVWAGFTAPPGEPAIRVPRREDWSATEAKVIGLCFCAIGVYAMTLLRDRK